MDLYLAGGVTGNCNPHWIDFCKNGRGGGLDALEIFLAGLQGETQWGGKDLAADEPKIDLFVLESFYYADEWTERIIPKLRKFMLDSGAFTFLNSGKGKPDWEAYVDRYADFINRNGVELFFELDIDPIIGYDGVLRLRQRLEDKTGKKPIPVWHKSRGKDEFLKMCEEYEYVSIGGIVTKEITRDEYKFFPWFIKEAHKRGCKIHGLGFTNLEWIRKCHFDSVDSTAWTTGNRFGAVYRFNGKTMVKYGKKEGQRLADPRAVAVNNFNEWVKFQRYAEKNL